MAKFSKGLCCAAVAALFVIPGLGLAQSYPTKPVRLFTGSGPGGGADQTSRVLAKHLSRVFNQQVVVENRPGATGMIANRLASGAAPDGYTLLLEPSSFVAISPHLNAKDGWDPRKRLAPIIQVSDYGLVLVVHPSVPAKTTKQLIALARKQPGVLNFATSGVGSNFHLSAELFKIGAKIDIVHIPYRGSANALIDLLAGRADLMFGLIPISYPYIKQGKLRALGMTAKKRNPLMPNVPTIDESGLPGYEVLSWEGVFAPVGTSPAIIKRLNSEIKKIVDSAEARKIWRNKGVETVTGTPADLGKRLNADYTRLGALLKKLNITK
ncbi:MAG: tripartite tricarboxylate transporter substrate binding protein [Betaproteobacteria bacterium]|nr:tripartite tricarboxylate transporter substrate binding protein [Betaproteobacteria bacterium]MDH3435371.1 tripartite tricarboxylate transporter substrate binding protein [Betaproteobacteria bacterium]